MVTDAFSSSIFLPLGQVAAVIRRDGAAMLARHPDYIDFLAESLKNNNAKRTLEEREEELGKVLFSCFK